MQTVVEGVLINYEVLGPKNKNTIVMLHGWKRNLKDWENIAKILQNKNKIVLVDMPGFGGSSNPKSSFDTFDYANLLEKLIEKLKLSNITLVGHSFGGKVGTIIAANSKLVKKLVLVDASGIDEKSFTSKVKIVLSKLIKPIMPLFPSSIRNSIFSKLASSDYKNAGNLKESFKKIVSQDVEYEAEKIKIPTLIIWGDKDPEVTTNSAKKFKSLIENSTLRIVWNTRHDPFLEKPEKFLEILNDFIKI